MNAPGYHDLASKELKSKIYALLTETYLGTY